MGVMCSQGTVQVISQISATYGPVVVEILLHKRRPLMGVMGGNSAAAKVTSRQRVA